MVFVDESGFSESPPVRRTWAPCGQTPVLRHHFNRKRLSAIGAIACQPDGGECRLMLHLQPRPVNAQSIVDFLNALHEQIAGPVVLLWDGLPAHRSNLVKEHVEKNKNWLAVERFPAYAPELNPVEFLWSALKAKDVANLCPNDIEQVENQLQLAACRLQNNAIILQGFLKASALFDDSSLVTSTAKTH